MSAGNDLFLGPMTRDCSKLERLFEERGADSIIAWRRGRTVSAREALDAARAWSTEWPDGSLPVNLCKDRYGFTLAILAALERGGSMLLPGEHGNEGEPLPLVRDSRQPEHDDEAVPRADILALNPRSRVPPIDGHDSLPWLLVETSGTQGRPVTYGKTEASLRQSAALIADFLGGVRGIRLVATVPPQHMYGLELSVLLALFQGAVIDARQPFFPADVLSALSDGPGPCALVTTPLHLRAILAGSPDPLPNVAFVVSATAPLDLRLAALCERRFKAPLLEIYGCTELGSLAGRQPARDPVWRWFEGVSIEHRGERSRVYAQHVPCVFSEADQIQALDAQRFHLGDRHAELVNIAGKRTSLSHLRQRGLRCEGIRDIAFLIINDYRSGVDRLACVFVADPHVPTEQIQSRLRALLEPVFMPRILTRVSAIPRNSTGKVPREALRRLCLMRPSEALKSGPESGLDHPPVETDHLTREVAGPVRDQKADQVSNFRRLPHATDGNQSTDGFGIEQTLGHRRSNEARCYDIGQHIPAGQLQGE